MTEQSDRYTYRVVWSEEDEMYVGLCAEFWGAQPPGRHSGGRRFRVFGTWWPTPWSFCVKTAPPSRSRFPFDGIVGRSPCAYLQRRIDLLRWTLPRPV